MTDWTEIAGGRFVLPSDAQWERVARGPSRRLFPWGDAWGERGAWLDAQPYYDPWPRGAHAELASADGVHDLVTRRWEWCAAAFTAVDAEALAELYPALRPDGRVRGGGEGAWGQVRLRAGGRLRTRGSARAHRVAARDRAVRSSADHG